MTLGITSQRSAVSFGNATEPKLFTKEEMPGVITKLGADADRFAADKDVLVKSAEALGEEGKPFAEQIKTAVEKIVGKAADAAGDTKGLGWVAVSLIAVGTLLAGFFAGKAGSNKPAEVPAQPTQPVQ